MRRYLIENVGQNPDAISKAVEWLADGGGTIVAPLKANLLAAFEVDTDREWYELEDEMARMGVTLQTARGGFSAGRRILALYPDSRLIDAIEGKCGVDELMVLGWTQNDWLEWKERTSPELLPWGRWPYELVVEVIKQDPVHAIDSVIEKNKEESRPQEQGNSRPS